MYEAEASTRAPSKEDLRTITSLKPVEASSKLSVGQPKHGLQKYSYSCGYSTFFKFLILTRLRSLGTGDCSPTGSLLEDHIHVNNTPNCNSLDMFTCVSSHRSFPFGISTNSNYSFWGSLWKAPELTGNLRGLVINRDGGIIGTTLSGAIINSTTSGNQHLGWELVDPSVFVTDEDVANAIVEEDAWVAVVSKSSILCLRVPSSNRPQLL